MGRKRAGLLRHDRMILVNELRAALSSWSDRAIALAVVLTAVVAAESALSERPLTFAATAVAAFAAVAGAGAARTIERRLDFHSRDGVLAADALASDAWRRYVVPIHALSCIVVTLLVAVVRPDAAVLAPIGYAIGAGICHAARRAMLTDGSPRRPSPFRAIGPLLHRPISGVFAAICAMLLMLLPGPIEPGPMAGYMGLVSAVAALLLTMLDYRVVRFMTESGYRAGRIVGIHARSLLTFLVPTVLASLILSDRLVAIVVSGVTMAALVLMTARILAYRAHTKRTADMLVSISVGVVGLAGIAMPMLLPFVVIAVLWHLHRRSVPATWLLT